MLGSGRPAHERIVAEREDTDGRPPFVEAHHQRVADYFEGRQDLLVLRIAAGDGWERLCPFLGEPVPDEPFPHRHRSGPQS